MNQPRLKQRVAAGEQQVAPLHTSANNHTSSSDWRSTVGMFTGDPIMKEIDKAARKLREADRRRAKRESSRKANRCRV
jgi:hypothetical protein